MSVLLPACSLGEANSPRVRMVKETNPGSHMKATQNTAEASEAQSTQHYSPLCLQHTARRNHKYVQPQLSTTHKNCSLHTAHLTSIQTKSFALFHRLFISNRMFRDGAMLFFLLLLALRKPTFCAHSLKQVLSVTASQSHCLDVTGMVWAGTQLIFFTEAHTMLCIVFFYFK